MKKHKKQIKKRVVILIFIIPIFLLIFPIKFIKKTTDSIRNYEFYIVICISEGSTEGGSWIIIEDHDGILDEGFPVYFTGKNPKDILSWDICNNYTEFVIYGSLTKETDDEFYTLNSREWEIFGEVKRGDYSLRIPFKHYITFYDLKWFDFLFTDKGYD